MTVQNVTAICFVFRTLKHAKAFSDDIEVGRRIVGKDYATLLAPPARRFRGHAVALVTPTPQKIEMLAGFYGGRTIRTKARGFNPWKLGDASPSSPKGEGGAAR